MKVKIYDEESEKDLERDINEFIENNDVNIIDVQFRTCVGVFSNEQIYCFSAMIMYK